MSRSRKINREKVQALLDTPCPKCGFMITPDLVVESLKPDCACAVQRETPENLAAGFDEALSPVRFGGKTYGIAAIFSDSCSNTVRFLCNPDCMAEREGFELSVPFSPRS
jgi:hypothetical protein